MSSTPGRSWRGEHELLGVVLISMDLSFELVDSEMMHVVTDHKVSSRVIVLSSILLPWDHDPLRSQGLFF